MAPSRAPSTATVCGARRRRKRSSYAAILDAHRRAAAAGRADFTDDAGLAEWAGLAVKLVAGSARNMKLTTAADIALAERLLSPAPALLEPRNGTRLRRPPLRAGRSRVAVRREDRPHTPPRRATPMPTSGCMR